jgi:hypothetical protein
MGRHTGIINIKLYDDSFTTVTVTVDNTTPARYKQYLPAGCWCKITACINALGFFLE